MWVVGTDERAKGRGEEGQEMLRRWHSFGWIFGNFGNLQYIVAEVPLESALRRVR